MRLGRPRRAALAIAAALAAVSCGGGDGQEELAAVTTEAPAETTTTAPATTTTLPPAGADTPVPAQPAPAAPPPPPSRVVTAAEAEAAVLQHGDLPEGWTAQPADEALRIDSIWQELRACMGLNGLDEPLAWAVSAGYRHGLATQARTMVEFRSQSSVQAISDALAGPAAAQCNLQVFTADVDRNAPEGAVREDINVTPLDVPPAGQQTFAWRTTARLDVSGLKVPVSIDFLVVFKGDAVMPMLFLDVPTPFPADLQRSLVEKVVSRA